MSRVLLLSAAILVGASACGGKEPPVGPTAGDLTVSYSGSGGNDGALLLLVTGGPVDAVTPLSPYRVESAPAGANATRMIVIGALSPGDILRLRVPDLAAAASYRVQVEAVADRATFALLDPGRYTAAPRK